MKITHTAGIIDAVTGQEIYCELIRNMIDGTNWVGEETLSMTVPVIEGTTTIVSSQLTVSARQLFDFLEGSGMT